MHHIPCTRRSDLPTAAKNRIFPVLARLSRLRAVGSGSYMYSFKVSQSDIISWNGIICASSHVHNQRGWNWQTVGQTQTRPEWLSNAKYYLVCPVLARREEILRIWLFLQIVASCINKSFFLFWVLFNLKYSKYASRRSGCGKANGVWDGG